MYQQPVRRLMSRLVILGILVGGLFVLTSPPRANAFVETCQTCDENFYVCYTLQGGNYFTCREAYADCIDFCTLHSAPGGGGSGGGACGRGRTTCDLPCSQARRDCIENDGDTCGADYEACMSPCCPS
jgi:hypothetical protein